MPLPIQQNLTTRLLAFLEILIGSNIVRINWKKEKKSLQNKEQYPRIQKTLEQESNFQLGWRI